MVHLCRSRSSSSSSIEQLFVDHIVDMMYNAYIDDSFLYEIALKGESKKQQVTQCCVHVFSDASMKTIRQCRNKGVRHENAPLVACSAHMKTYLDVDKPRKEAACAAADESYTNFMAEKTSDNAKKKLIVSIYKCVNARLIVMHRYFKPYTPCERRLQGHLGALRWFDKNLLREALEVAASSTDDKAVRDAPLSEPEPSIAPIEQTSSTSELRTVERNDSETSANKNKKMPCSYFLLCMLM